MMKKNLIIEIGFVVVVILLVVFYISSSGGDLSDVSAEAAGRRVQSDIRYAQHLAKKTGVNHGVIFVTNNGYEVYKINPGTTVVDPVTKQKLVVDLSDFDGVTIGTNYQVEFNDAGKTVMGGDGKVRLKSSSGAIRDIYVIEKSSAVVVDLIEYGSGCKRRSIH